MQQRTMRCAADRVRAHLRSWAWHPCASKGHTWLRTWAWHPFAIAHALTHNFVVCFSPCVWQSCVVQGSGVQRDAWVQRVEHLVLIVHGIGEHGEVPSACCVPCLMCFAMMLSLRILVSEMPVGACQEDRSPTSIGLPNPDCILLSSTTSIYLTLAATLT